MALSRMNQDELRQIEDAIKLRRLSLRQADPVVYTIVRSMPDKDARRYITRVRGEGKKQFLATDFQHLNLRLFTSRDDAQKLCNEFASGSPWGSYVYAPVEIDKGEMLRLPCHIHYYYKFESFVYRPETTDEIPTGVPVGTITFKEPIVMKDGERLEITYKAAE
jgi:hypothetical protein